MANKGSALSANGILLKGDFLLSPSGQYQAVLQDDGNLVVYDLHSSNKAIWQSDTANKPVDNAVMQPDGNFVVYGFPAPEWASNSKHDHPGVVVMGDDGYLAVYQLGTQWWSSKPAHA
jgi:hypothetical protein